MSDEWRKQAELDAEGLGRMLRFVDDLAMILPSEEECREARVSFDKVARGTPMEGLAKRGADELYNAILSVIEKARPVVQWRKRNLEMYDFINEAISSPDGTEN